MEESIPIKHICVYTTPDVLEHKRSNECVEYYWEFNSYPKILKDIDFRNMEDDELPRLYFAIKGNIVGYFDPCEYDIGIKQIVFSPSDWVNLKEPIPQKPFQGFKYLNAE